MSDVIENRARIFPVAPAGVYQAVVCDVTSKNVETAWGEKTKTFIFFMFNAQDPEGFPILALYAANRSLDEKSNLRRMISKILGRDPGNRYDLDELVGKNVIVDIRLNDYQDKTYMNVHDVTPVPETDKWMLIPETFLRKRDRSKGEGPWVDPYGEGRPPEIRWRAARPVEPAPSAAKAARATHPAPAPRTKPATPAPAPERAEEAAGMMPEEIPAEIVSDDEIPF